MRLAGIVTRPKDIWDYLVADAVRAGSLGKLLGDYLDDKVSLAVAPGHTSKEAKTYPPAAVAIPVLDGALAWEWGDWAELVPADTITSDFIIIGIMIEPLDRGQDRQWEIQLGTGGAGSEVPKVSMAGAYRQESAAGRRQFGWIIPLSAPHTVPANSRVAGRGCSDNPPRSMDLKIQYIELPL